MTTKFTRGPWEAVGNLVRSPMHQPDGLPRGVQIVECMDGYSQPFTEEAKANARLISAAPELLEALKILTERIAYYASLAEGEAPNIEQWAYTDGSSDVAKARSAIAKATGGAQ